VKDKKKERERKRKKRGDEIERQRDKETEPETESTRREQRKEFSRSMTNHYVIRALRTTARFGFLLRRIASLTAFPLRETPTSRPLSYSCQSMVLALPLSFSLFISFSYTVLSHLVLLTLLVLVLSQQLTLVEFKLFCSSKSHHTYQVTELTVSACSFASVRSALTTVEQTSAGGLGRCATRTEN
jgi:hypothetical protein